MLARSGGDWLDPCIYSWGHAKITARKIRASSIQNGNVARCCFSSLSLSLSLSFSLSFFLSFHFLLSFVFFFFSLFLFLLHIYSLLMRLRWQGRWTPLVPHIVRLCVTALSSPAASLEKPLKPGSDRYWPRVPRSSHWAIEIFAEGRFFSCSS